MRLDQVHDDQSMFSYVVQFLRRQGCKSLSDDGDCVYHYKRYRCAAGCLIRKQFYDDAFEGSSADNVDVLNAIALSTGFSRERDINYSLLLELQRIHDDYNLDEWEERFAITADRWTLDLPS